MVPDDVRYADALREPGHGYALWEADPDESPTVELGCAGPILNGKLLPKWRMWDDPSSVQDDTIQQIIEVETPIRTANINEVAVVPVLGNSVNVGLDFGSAYQCSGASGALISLADKFAICEDLKKSRVRELIDHILSRPNEILRDCRLDDIKDLVVVTGTTMTGDWDAFYFRTDTYRADANLTQLTLPRTSVNVKYYDNQTLRQISGHNHSNAQNARFAGQCCDGPKNQCVFVRTLRFRDRSTHQAIKDMTKTAETGDVHSENLDLYDELFDYIFTKSEASMAVVHDRDVQEMMRQKSENSTVAFGIAVHREHDVAAAWHRTSPFVDYETWKISEEPVKRPALAAAPDSEDTRSFASMRNRTQSFFSVATVATKTGSSKGPSSLPTTPLTKEPPARTGIPIEDQRTAKLKNKATKNATVIRGLHMIAGLVEKTTAPLAMRLLERSREILQAIAYLEMSSPELVGLVEQVAEVAVHRSKELEDLHAAVVQESETVKDYLERILQSLDNISKEVLNPKTNMFKKAFGRQITAKSLQQLQDDLELTSTLLKMQVDVSLLNERGKSPSEVNGRQPSPEDNGTKAVAEAVEELRSSSLGAAPIVSAREASIQQLLQCYTTPPSSYRDSYEIQDPAGPRFYRNVHLRPRGSTNTSQERPTANAPLILFRSSAPTAAAKSAPVGIPNMHATISVKPGHDVTDLLDITDPYGETWHHDSRYDVGLHRNRRGGSPSSPDASGSEARRASPPRQTNLQEDGNDAELHDRAKPNRAGTSRLYKSSPPPVETKKYSAASSHDTRERLYSPSTPKPAEEKEEEVVVVEVEESRTPVEEYESISSPAVACSRTATFSAPEVLSPLPLDSIHEEADLEAAGASSARKAPPPVPSRDAKPRTLRKTSTAAPPARVPTVLQPGAARHKRFSSLSSVIPPSQPPPKQEPETPSGFPSSPPPGPSPPALSRLTIPPPPPPTAAVDDRHSRSKPLSPPPPSRSIPNIPQALQPSDGQLRNKRQSLPPTTRSIPDIPQAFQPSVGPSPEFHSRESINPFLSRSSSMLGRSSNPYASPLTSPPPNPSVSRSSSLSHRSQTPLDYAPPISQSYRTFVPPPPPPLLVAPAANMNGQQRNSDKLATFFANQRESSASQLSPGAQHYFQKAQEAFAAECVRRGRQQV